MAMRIHGMEGLSPAEIEAQLAAGGRFVLFEYCISLVAVTLRRPSAAYFLRPGERGIVRGFPYTLLSLLLGWWGVPWGFIYTPLVIVTNLSGGCDITTEVRALLKGAPDPSQSW
jgi:hypothetical protein